MNNQPPGMPPMGSAPLLGQRQQQQEAAINQVVQGLSLQIYTQLATSHIGTQDQEIGAVDPEALEQLAKDSMVAAKAYFVGIGVATFDEKGTTKEG